MIPWQQYLGADTKEETKLEGAQYYCGCDYTAGVPNCEHHGDPVESYGKVKKAE